MGRYALLIGTREYQGPGFGALPAVEADLHYLHQVLEDLDIGKFEVTIEPDPSADRMRTAIGGFLDTRKPEDLVLLYLSGHGAWSPDAGQLYFVGSDTSRDGLSSTGVPAEYVNNVLEECRARQKVLLLDCCDSGAYAQGFRVRGAADQQDRQEARRAMTDAIRSRGVYVITASDQRQPAYEEESSSQGPKPALFTNAVVEGLRTGRAAGAGKTYITPDDLFTYVSDRVRMHSLETGKDQSPTKSAIGVVGAEIILAHSVAEPYELDPLTRDSADGRAGSGARAAVVADDSAVSLDADGWRRLLGYYRDCLGQEAANDSLLDTEQKTFAVWPGAETILVGEASRVRVPVGSDAEALVGRVQAEGKTLAYGYPAVLLFEGKHPAKLAPLFNRVVEPVRDGDGWALEPVGPVLLHSALLRRQLGGDDAEALMAEFEPNWDAGAPAQLATAATTLLKELDLTTESLRPSYLDENLNVQHGKPGRNVAVLYEAPESTQKTRGVVDGLGKLREQPNFAGTALAALSDPDSDGENGGAAEFRVVAPFALNEAQEMVLRSAMTRRLTVATGPPGTGKSQLVANLLATAVANGQSVLVTSTNNRAVDEVWERCKSIHPGLLVRTGGRGGKRDYEQEEIDCLRRLLATVAAPTTQPDQRKLGLCAQDLDTVRKACADKVRAEVALLQLGRRRTELADALGLDPTCLPSAMSHDAKLDSWQRRARNVSQARLLGGWRRRRLAAQLGLADAERETCKTVADFCGVETAWRRARAAADRLPSDATLHDDLRRHQKAVEDAADELVKAIVAGKVRQGHWAIEQRLQALQGNGKSSWSGFNKARAYLRGWAVTTHSAGRLPPDRGWFDLVIVDEATQCSIPAVLPMLYRAKRALIIGDPM
ncbi:MAG: caspase, EACC1-associated type [Egibacteraceae bacterium]